MQYDNNATRTRRTILVRIARLFMEDKLEGLADRIPLEMRPKGSSSFRCCVYKDRALIKYRIMAALGFSMDEETDELEKLESYSIRSIKRAAAPQGEPLLLLDEACSACVKSKYFVTNACRGCMARPCMLNCPKKAIAIDEKGQAVINSSKCVNCGICMKVCPYHAIIRIPVPCEEACPTGAIVKDGEGRAQIDFDKCIYCGKCMRQCPFGAIMERSQMIDVLKALKSKKRVVAIIAPASAAQFVAGYPQVVTALKTLGFEDVLEVASGALTTAKMEAAEFEQRISEGASFMTSSCCPSFVMAVEKHVPKLKEKVSHTPTPMHFTAEAIKKEDSDTVVVFVGPCVAKRKEAENDPLVDYVLTSEEIASMMAAAQLDVSQCDEDLCYQQADPSGRRFPLIGGVTNAVAAQMESPETVERVLIDGLSRKSMKILKMYASKGIPGNFLEAMACERGCINGPCTTENVAPATARIKNMADSLISTP
ncbi:monomeric [FeFe] hydrogenase [Chitinispirillales bacterium ANBcel5]|uniref:monomeric [FeFe] hydrogenase n=1 Tax=Cellulosispirillum alkaliphilum TaxID=3039283 RepID=UPI002A50F567|nr:monomeric [FeFe] hydrogenase [Chitinispirillales bacterium ANBcel5]